ncbi:SDR family oxidoreductase [Egicoccus sp. AB-alg2]|uniref:SDR family oxidoreductase n=1 Tax=Egicoccus sp. AB-alg2 TaxID=3242693 RepID=UPI00359CFC8F
MDLGIAGRTSLVLGAGGGLGSAIAESLAGEGVAVAAADIDGGAARSTADRCASRGVSTTALAWDLADIDAIDGHVAAVEADLGPVDILVNMTGGPPPTPVSGQDAASWRRHFEQMVLSVISVTDRVLPSMRARSWGRVITSTSSGVVAPIPNLGLSNALRSSLVGWNKTLAAEVAADGVTCNIVLPGRIATKRITFLDEKKAEREGRPVADVVAESTASIPVGRYGDPAEYGAVAAFLASKQASFVNGSIIRVDGGMIPSV